MKPAPDRRILEPVDSADVLLRTSIFRDLAREDVEELLPLVRPLTFARGESLWNEGAPAGALYVVAKGQVKSYRVSREGAELILEIVSSGECTGEVGLFHPGGARLVSVSAMEPTICLTVAREPLVAFMTRHPPVMLRMLEKISATAGRAAYSLSDVAFEDIRRRVARTLVSLTREQGEPTASGVRIRLKLSQATLAAMVAASRENVNRALAVFLSSGAISQHEGFFFVHDGKALEAEADSEP
jgi:CRP-like cAMP-binding protein